MVGDALLDPRWPCRACLPWIGSWGRPRSRPAHRLPSGDIGPDDGKYQIAPPQPPPIYTVSHASSAHSSAETSTYHIGVQFDGTLSDAMDRHHEDDEKRNQARAAVAGGFVCFDCAPFPYPLDFRVKGLLQCHTDWGASAVSVRNFFNFYTRVWLPALLQCCRNRQLRLRAVTDGPAVMVAGGGWADVSSRGFTKHWKVHMASLGITDDAQVRFWIKGLGRSVEILRFCHGQCLYDLTV